MRRLVAGLALLAAFTTACGSTVQTTGTSTAGATGGDGLSAPITVGGLDAAGQPVAPAQLDAAGQPLSAAGPRDSSAGAGIASTGGGQVTTGGASAPGAPAGSVGAAPAGPRVTTPMKVGIVVQDNNGEAAKSFGIDADNGDEKAVAAAIVARINKTGGLGGRQLQAVYYEGKTADFLSKPATQISQEICAALTQDDRVEVAVYYDLIPGLAECLQKAGVPLLTSYPGAAPSEQKLRELALFASIAPSIDRLARLYAEDLAAQGFFRGSKGLGLVVEERPQHMQVARDLLVPLLKRLGVDVDVVYSPEAEARNVSAIGSAMSSAVLRWRSQGRDRVMFFAPYSIHALTFMQQAENQGYRPRYGLTSAATPTLLAGTVSENQLRGAVGAGTSPPNDAAANYWRADPPGYAQCRADQKSANVSYDKGSTPDFVAVSFCDILNLVDIASDQLAARGAPVLGKSIIDSVVTLGDRMRTASMQGTLFTPRTRAGGARYQRFAYVEACKCFQYTSDPLPIA